MAEISSGIVDAGLAAGSSDGSLYVVATPIGHLSDLGARAAEVLRSVDVVAAEDTRTSRVLLDRVGSHASPMAAHRHNELEAGERIVALLAQGRNVALISDAGTPAISDPGARIVAMALRAGHRVVPIPGWWGLGGGGALGGGVLGVFQFVGFLPTRAMGRADRLALLARMPHAFVLFEAPHRIARTLPAIAAACGDTRWLALGRELTKRFEEIHVCRAGAAAAWLAADPNRERGEYVLVVAAESASAGQAQPQSEAAEAGSATVEVAALLAALLEELPVSRAVRIAERATGLPHRLLYRLALESAQRREAP